MRNPKRECDHCHTRLLVVRGVPPLNYTPDPAGTVAVSIADPRKGRFLSRAEEPGLLEKRYSVHECDGAKRAAQRGQWSAAVAGLHREQRNRRGKRRGPDVSGMRVAPPTLPGMP